MASDKQHTPKVPANIHWRENTEPAKFSYKLKSSINSIEPDTVLCVSAIKHSKGGLKSMTKAGLFISLFNDFEIQGSKCMFK